VNDPRRREAAEPEEFAGTPTGACACVPAFLVSAAGGWLRDEDPSYPPLTWRLVAGVARICSNMAVSDLPLCLAAAGGTPRMAITGLRRPSATAGCDFRLRTRPEPFQVAISACEHDLNRFRLRFQPANAARIVSGCDFSLKSRPESFQVAISACERGPNRFRLRFQAANAT
jgi:hypothetical protein